MTPLCRGKVPLMPLRVVLFDVNATLSNLEPLRGRLEQAGAPRSLLETWFAGTLRDGFALATAGAYADFRTVGVGVLSGLLAAVGTLRADADETAEQIVAGLAELQLHPDVADGMRRFADAGIRMATLTNGSSEVATKLLERAGLVQLVERSLSVEQVRRWKPAPEPYLYAARECGVAAEECVLVAAHPWDVDGAKRAGLRAGWLDRRGGRYPRFFAAPDASGRSLAALADALLAHDPMS